MAEEKNKNQSVWSKYSNIEKFELENLSKGYINFLSTCKTERESVNHAIKAAEDAGYKNFA